IQSRLLSWKNHSNPPPIVSPATTCSQNPNGLDSPASIVRPTNRIRSPAPGVTIAVQLPPPDTRSVAKYQADPARKKTMNGKRKTASAKEEAKTAKSSRTSSAKWKPRKPTLTSSSQPNQLQREPTTTTAASTAVIASRPAVTGCPASFAPKATTTLTARTNSARRTKPAAPWSFASTPSSA